LGKRYKKLPTFNLPNALIDSFRLSGIMILIAKFFTTATLGQFSLAWKMVQIPMSLIGASLSQVFFQKVASAKKSDLNSLIKRYLTKALLVSTPIFLIIYFFATDIFIVVFGENWKLAGEVASIMSPWLLLNFLTTPMANIFIILNRQEIVLIVSIFYMLVPISILLVQRGGEFLYSIKLITISMILILLLYMVLVFIYTKKEKSNDL
jgi:O-antigen/teichoic acid export membrane protein